MTTRLPRLNLIGAGRLGRSLARLWHRAGVLEIGLVCDIATDVAADAVRFIGAGTAATTTPSVPAAFTLIATRDDAIRAAAVTLANSGILRSGDIVFHCSGALTADVLSVARARDAMVASVHPMRAFADPAAATQAFAGTVCASEGDASAVAALAPLFEAIGGRRIDIAPQHKLLYHAGAVMACNHLVALMEGAVQCLEHAGLPRDDAWRALRPLVDGTLAAIDHAGTQKALTGPLARGDRETVRAECAATAALDPDIGRAYAALSALALHLTPAGHPISRSDLGLD
ncbi:Rossmann-like and DUF2520 domain-containing protein [Niveibacterium umoris]|uniref:Putative short-subunit dehydrogenase-like oxidoreductase (DUF2520 family) n=1 Tax=Niveibacterium umoris TaxID=1193620 RepID=A0A840BPS7_9RHOO|nr:Rossmann-like and DUF2520 domain-containing protein [Niveibacterium umoris]MBB4014674.1 putative short-subunit dehydrogenase-like oxidoreductase (DUF2520 family) [Niveibacterium umoris]